MTAPVWDSFEALRVAYSDNLAQLEDGVIGRLHVKRSTYVILTEEDFGQLQQVFSDVAELQTHCETLRQAATIFGDMAGEDAALRGLNDLLRHAVAAIGRSCDTITQHAALG